MDSEELTWPGSNPVCATNRTKLPRSELPQFPSVLDRLATWLDAGEVISVLRTIGEALLLRSSQGPADRRGAPQARSPFRPTVPDTAQFKNTRSRSPLLRNTSLRL